MSSTAHQDASGEASAFRTSGSWRKLAISAGRMSFRKLGSCSVCPTTHPGLIRSSALTIVVRNAGSERQVVDSTTRALLLSRASRRCPMHCGRSWSAQSTASVVSVLLLSTPSTSKKIIFTGPNSVGAVKRLTCASASRYKRSGLSSASTMTGGWEGASLSVSTAGASNWDGIGDAEEAAVLSLVPKSGPPAMDSCRGVVLSAMPLGMPRKWSRARIKAYPRMLRPRHSSGHFTRASRRGNPMPQMQSFGAASAKILLPVESSTFCALRSAANF
mmetsp:Transcript_947/g.1922  ORF Transcript_947/g.1922 Transcript_947/m.1922 type:complete len:274 (-) Transcript_947:521-1342(-)